MPVSGVALGAVAAGGVLVYAGLKGYSVTNNGASHGPATPSWLVFGTSVPAAQAQPGDAIVWATHMGIYVGGGQMVSALNHSLGTRQTTVAGGAPGGEGPGSYRRIA